MTTEGRSEQLLAALKGLKTAPEGGSLSTDDKRQNQAAFKAIDDFFDYPRLTSEAIAPHKKALSAQQMVQFDRDFRDLVRFVSYPKSASFIHEAQVQVGAPRAVGAKTLVDIHAAVAERDMETTITFQWEGQGAAARITDVSFDGVSVVKDYQNQFGKIIKRDGAEGLLKKLSKRLQEERKAHEP